MNVRTLLSPATIQPALGAATKMEALRELVAIAGRTGAFSDADAVLEALRHREERMSTGMEAGVALPHAKTDAVAGLVAAFGVSQRGIDFEAMDGRPSHIFLLTLSPLSKSGPHLQLMGEMARILRSPRIRRDLLNAHDPDLILEILSAPPSS